MLAKLGLTIAEETDEKSVIVFEQRDFSYFNLHFLVYMRIISCITGESRLASELSLPKKSIKPNIYGLFVITGHRNAPVYCSSRNWKIPKTILNPSYHLTVQHMLDYNQEHLIFHLFLHNQMIMQACHEQPRGTSFKRKLGWINLGLEDKSSSMFFWYFESAKKKLSSFRSTQGFLYIGQHLPWSKSFSSYTKHNNHFY